VQALITKYETVEKGVFRSSCLYFSTFQQDSVSKRRIIYAELIPFFENVRYWCCFTGGIMKLLFTALVLALISSCGKAPTMPQGHQGKSSENLTGKSDSEILGLKYNHQIHLACAVYVQETPVDQFQ
jgi:hypothetical protein